MKVNVAGNVFYNMDCIEGSKKHLPDSSIDLIVTDPPYGIDGDKLDRHYNRDESYVVGGYVEVPWSEYGRFSHEWIHEAERILRPGGQIYIVSGYTNLYHILDAIRHTSLEEINHIIWKFNFGVYTRRKFVSSHYHILYYAKPGSNRTFNLDCRYGPNERDEASRSLNYQDREDVWVINREYKPGQVKNKNELPTALLVKMIQYSSNEGDTVCDLFLGGFSTARVAIGLNRKSAGFELSETIFAHGVDTVRKISPGYLVPSLRTPHIERPRNQGLAWSDEEFEMLQERYRSLRQQGARKGEIVDMLCSEFGRGRFAIEKKLGSSGPSKREETQQQLPISET